MGEESGRFEGETEIDEMLLRLLDGRLVSILTAYNRVTRRVRFKIVERKIKKPKATRVRCCSSSARQRSRAPRS